MRNTVISILLIGIVSLAAACGGGAATTPSTFVSSSTGLPGTPVSVAGGGTYWEITPAQLAGLEAESYFMADTDANYIGEISGTDLFIKPANISANMNKFPADKNAKIVLYCTMGLQSQDAAVILVKAGYTRVMELKGGITAWKNQGYQTQFVTRTMI